MNTIRRAALFGAIAVVVIAVLAGCGASGPPEKGLLITGPGIRATAPPWTPQYAGLAQRIKTLGLPTGDSEKFHIHAQLSIHNQGLLVTVPANLGIDERHHIETTIHTHDATGIIHMEAPRPYRYTLGDLFAIWGVRFGAGTLGALQDHGADRVWVYVNGSLLTDPARHFIANGDSISIGYGPNSSFPHEPDTSLLKQVLAGKSTLSCTDGPTKKQKVCRAPKHPSKTATSRRAPVRTATQRTHAGSQPGWRLPPHHLE
jgi:hypothetical protein